MSAQATSDAEVMAISRKHCVNCHAREPKHPAFREPPKNMPLETIAELKQFARPVLQQTVLNRAMPLGNLTEMTEEEREKLGAWVRALR
jgi:uncharacterized membrane protein